jgi:hypothetical protein
MCHAEARVSLDAFSKTLNVSSNQTNAQPRKAGLERNAGMPTCRIVLKNERKLLQACVPATASSQYIRVLSFARFNDTLSVIEKHPRSPVPPREIFLIFSFLIISLSNLGNRALNRTLRAQTTHFSHRGKPRTPRRSRCGGSSSRVRCRRRPTSRWRCVPRG